jgi:hypothetical protein
MDAERGGRYSERLMERDGGSAVGSDAEESRAQAPMGGVPHWGHDPGSPASGPMQQSRSGTPG